jgi:hypothetical protein
MATPEQEPTLGEVHRLLVRMDGEAKDFRQEARQDIGGIRQHLKELNGKTFSHAQRIAVLDAARQATAPQSAEISELLQIVRDFKGATRLGKLFWGVFTFLGGIAIVWGFMEFLKQK